MLKNILAATLHRYSSVTSQSRNSKYDRGGLACQQGYAFAILVKVYLCLVASQCLWMFLVVFHVLELGVKFSSQGYPYAKHSGSGYGTVLLFMEPCKEKSGQAGIIAFSFLLAQRHSEVVVKCMGDKSPKK